MQTKRILKLLEFILDNEGETGIVTRYEIYKGKFYMREAEICRRKGLLGYDTNGHFIRSKGISFMIQHGTEKNIAELNKTIGLLHKDIKKFAKSSDSNTWVMLTASIAMIILAAVQVVLSIFLK